MTVRSILTACAHDLLETEDIVSAEQIVACAYQNHAEDFRSEQQRMVWQAARDIAKQVMRRLSEDDGTGQLRFPGLRLPSVIAVPDENGDFFYVRSDKATLVQLEAGREVRVSNVEAARAKLDQYDEALDLLRPFMAHDETLTVAEAWRQYRAAS